MAWLALGAFSAYSQVRLVSRAEAGETISPDEASANDTRERVLYLLTAVPFLMWLHRAYANLVALGAVKLKFTPGWAVGWFFVPFANFVRPYQVLEETWNKSAPTLADGSLPEDEEPRIVAIWWALFLVFSFTRGASGRPETPISEQVVVSWILFVNSLFGILAAIAAILVIRGIDQRQIARREQVAGSAVMPKSPEPVGLNQGNARNSSLPAAEPRRSVVAEASLVVGSLPC
jgi:hypothetical protein